MTLWQSKIAIENSKSNSKPSMFMAMFNNYVELPEGR
jgi:hypothetical protein